jgi:hypothetical protein
MSWALVLTTILHGQSRGIGVGDKWKITSSKNPMNDTATVTASLNAEGPIVGRLNRSFLPTLIVRCSTPLKPDNYPPIIPVQPGLEVYVVTGMPATVENAEGLHQVGLRYDDAAAYQSGMSESTDHQSLFFSAIESTRAAVTYRTLVKSKRLLVQFTPFQSSPVIITFDTRGFEKHVDQVLTACPRADRSKWSFPPGMEPPGWKSDLATSLLGLTGDELRTKLGEPQEIAGARWTYGALRVYLDPSGKVTDVQPPTLDLTTLKR